MRVQSLRWAANSSTISIPIISTMATRRFLASSTTSHIGKAGQAKSGAVLLRVPGRMSRNTCWFQSATLINFFKGGKESATLIGGVPTYWRTLERDFHADAEWARIYRSFDIVSPWIVGRLKNEAEADWFEQERMASELRDRVHACYGTTGKMENFL